MGLELKHLESLRDSIVARSVMLDHIGAFFRRENFIEVSTPLLALAPECEWAIEPFETKYKDITSNETISAYLSTSPEYAMKSLLSSGHERIFQITRSFRNGERMRWHEPEFALLEFYRKGHDHHAIMRDLEALTATLLEALSVDTKTFQLLSKPFCWTKTFLRFAIDDLFKLHAGIEIDPTESGTSFQKRAEKCGMSFHRAHLTWNDVFNQIFAERVEPQLPKGQPFFLYDYPVPEAPLARENPKKPGFAERFELFFGAIEIANGFHELTDARIQKTRFERVQKERAADGKTSYPLPESYLRLLERGLPPCAGVAVGLDRMLMVFLQKASLREVVAFPFDMT